MMFIKNEPFNLEYSDILLDCGLKIRFIRKKGYVKKAVYLSVSFGGMYQDFTYMGKEYHIKSGIAHAIEHKIYENTDGSDSFKELSMMGVDANAFTTQSITCYYFLTPNEITKPMLKTFDFIFNPSFNQNSLDREIPIILEENRRKEEDIYYWYDYKMLELLYGKGPKSNPVLGFTNDIKHFKAEELWDAYNSFYKPSNMNLVIVGDMDFDMVLKDIKNYFKSFKYEEFGKIKLNSEDYSDLSYTIRNSNVEIPKAALGFKIINPTIKDYYLLNALFYCMYSSSTPNRLQMIDKGLINTSLDITIFSDYNMLYTTISIEDKDASHMIDNIIDNINSFDISQITEEDILLFKRYYLGGAYFLGDNIELLAESMAFRLCVFEDILESPKLINEITLSDVKRCFEYYKNVKKVKILMK